ncbi:MAG TPA: dehydrogenase, partial [Beijerinckiaceae bacterium]|nr:dehydrogenase [Beijerinckiaceae bacterium]
MNKGESASPSRALWYVTRGRAELREDVLPALDEGDARVRSLYGALSRGTERLVFEGRVSMMEGERMRAPLQEGDFPYPVKYGYCTVGRVEAGPDELRGRTVFALHPHQDVFVAPAAMLCPVPEAVPPRRAVLAANMETALNALWDSGAGPGDRIVVVGAG